MSRYTHAWNGTPIARRKKSLSVILLLIVSACAMDSVPVATFRVHLDGGEQIELERFMVSFATERGFSVRDRSRESDLAGGRRVSVFRFTHSDGIAMGLGDYMDGMRFWVAIYDDRGTDGWRELYADSQYELMSRWPATVVEYGPIEARSRDGQ